MVVTVAGARVPAWHARAIEHLREVAGLAVRVVALPGRAAAPASGLTGALAGAAMRPRVVPLDGGGLDGADVVLNLSGAVLDGASSEVWSLQAGEAGELPFEREIAAGGDTVSIALVREGDERACLRTGRFAVTRWYGATLKRALFEAARWPAICAHAAVQGIPLAAAPSPLRSGGEPPARRVRFAAMLAVRAVRSLVETAFEITEWNVGLAPGDARTIVSGEPLEVRWLPRPRPRSFLADPFLVERDGRRVLFAEDYTYERDRGVIDALELDADGNVLARHRVLDLPTHLSYPFPLEIDGTLYLIPENCAGNEVALYRCVAFPTRWEREAAIFPDFDGVDTSLVAYGGRWWAFCTRYAHGSMQSLYAFFADSPRGPWTPHALNPIVVDVARARPAGAPFTVDGVLYRPAQDCSATYGGGVVVTRVDELSPHAYRETVVRRIDGRDVGTYCDGVHTLTFASGTIGLDGKRVYHDVRKVAWVLQKAGVKLRARIKRAARSLAGRAGKASLLKRV